MRGMKKSSKRLFSVLAVLAAVLCISVLGAVSVSAAKKHSTVLNGQKYDKVYDYNYYTTKVHPELAGKSDKVVLQYFVNSGMPRQEKGIATFSAKSYRLGNQDLRKAFGKDYKAYYLHYQNYGCNESSRVGTTTGVTKLRNPITVYKGVDYSKVYDYFYYVKKHPAVAKNYKDDDYGLLKSFVERGMAKQYQANKSFNVKSYRYGNPDLRVKFKSDYKQYYLHYIQSGYQNRSSTALGITSLRNIITTYNGVDYSAIYDFKYYVSHNPAVSKYKDDDASAIEHFIKKGIIMGLQAKAGVTRSSKAYQTVLLRLYPNMANDEYVKANQYNSKTSYLILLNQNRHTVYIFQGKQYEWQKIATFPCCVGKPSTPTPVGVFTIGSRGLYFLTNSGSARCWYYTQIYYSILFHSQVYDDSSSPVHLIDASMGVSCSHGCVRLYLSNAQWIHANIPRGTTVVSYNRPW